MQELIRKGIIDELKDTIVQKEHTLTVAERITGGILQAVISRVTEASQFFQGGITFAKEK